MTHIPLSARSARSVAVLALACAAASCFIDVDYTDTSYACSDGVTCPNGFVCEELRCVANGVIDAATVDAPSGPADAADPADASEPADAADPADAGTPVAIELAPVADTFINVNTDVNAGAVLLNTHTWPDNTLANAILMKFDLATVPAGATVLEADLKLTLVEADSTADATYTITLHKIINVEPDLALATGLTYDGVNPWTPSDCCYDGIPLAQSDVSSAHDTVVVTKELGPIHFDATLMVGEWLANPSSNRGLLVNSDPSKLIDRYRYFASSEHSNSAARPVLEVTYVP